MQLDKTIAEVDDSFSKYRLSEAMMAVYKLFWDEFSSWYLEMAKPGYQQPIDKATYEATLGFFDALLRLLHPFMRLAFPLSPISVRRAWCGNSTAYSWNTNLV